MLAALAAPAPEREARLRALVRAHPDWPSAARELAALPPGPPREAILTLVGEEAELAWNAPTGSAPDTYLVERHGPGDASRVLGRTDLTRWDDRAAPGVWWTVRALRGRTASEPLAFRPGSEPDAADDMFAPLVGAGAATAATADSAVTALRATASRPVVLTWSAPGPVRIRRTRGLVVRPLVPDPAGGYVDCHVAPGATYRYAVAPVGQPGAAQEIEVTVPASGAAPAPASATPPLATPAIPAIRLGLDRLPDGRLRARWDWPEGVTEAWIAWAPMPPEGATTPGRKVTNMRYEIDGGALLDGVAPGDCVAVLPGFRTPAGGLSFGAPLAGAVAP